MPSSTHAAAAPDSQPLAPVITLVAVLAAAAPALLAYNLPPSATLLNQCLAVSLWGWFAALVAAAPSRASLQSASAALAALGLLAAGVLASLLGGSLPASLGLSALGLLAASALLCALGAALATRGDALFVWGWVLLGLVVAGLLSALVALVQVFVPQLADGELIARSGLAGRAVGNLRQPNHLSSLLLWAAVAAVALFDLRRLRLATALTVYLLLLGGVVLSGSRTGALSTLLLAAWGGVDRRLARPARLMLMAAPLLYGAFWLGDALWSHLTNQAAAVELGAGSQRHDISSSRFGIWANTLVLIARHPWAGVGFGEFNLAWTLTPFPGRPVALFDHTHNIALQFAVELGVPVTLLVLGLLGLALWQAARRAFGHEGEAGRAARAAVMLVALMALHSQFEYPLWYAYFLLPTALAWGFALGTAGAQATPLRPSVPMVAAGTVLAVGGALAVLDYMRVVVIFSPPEGAAALQERIARGQKSVFFAHHADYAAVTTGLPESPEAQALGWRRAPHQLLDARLMIAWAQALADAGEVDRARHIAARLREFNKPEAAEFFAPCAQPGATAFQCQAPQQPHGWREFAGGR